MKVSSDAVRKYSIDAEVPSRFLPGGHGVLRGNEALMKFRKLGMTLTTLAVVAGAVFAAPMAAQASDSHSVSGTVYEGGAWYKSSTTRSVAKSGTKIYLNLNSVPAKGIQWRLVNSKNSKVFSDTVTLNSAGTKTLVDDVLAGTVFQNDYRQNSTCNSSCGGYNFSGSEIY